MGERVTKKQIEKNDLEEFPVMRLNPLNLTFAGEWTQLEQIFLRDYTSKSVKYIRLAFLLGIFLYSIFGILDSILMPEKKAIVWFIRYGVVCPIIFVCILLSFWSGFQKYSQAFIVFVILLAGGGISVMVAVAPPPASFSYYAGVILVLMLGYGFVKARFIWASLAGWLNVVIYEIVAIGITQTPDTILINNNFFFISANIIGMFSSYAFEFYTRRDFFMARMLSTEREKVTELNLDLEKIIHKRTFELQKANDTLKQEIKDKEALQSQLIQAQKMESIGRLAGGVAHDYNNISSIIIGYAELAMERVKLSDPLHADLVEILTAAKRSTGITRQLLAFARRQTIAPKVLDLNDTIGNMIKMLRRLIGEDIDLAWLPGAEVWPVKIDPSQVDQILANLCVNARDAIADVGKVTIETKNVSFDEDYCADHTGFIPGDFVLLAVSDDGSGMAPETVNKIFEPFFTTKDFGKGTGLGLSTVYGIVKQNNGFINVYSELEKGTTIKMYLLRHTGQVVQVKNKNTIEIHFAMGETVLLVEDDPTILKLGKRILEDLGYRVMSASSPDEAVKLAENHSSGINLLITDVVMPEMNGRELSEYLQSLYPELKVLFMSGYTANVIAHRGVLDDGVNFISKPFSKNDMAVKVREVLDNGHV
jgi:signal transduction histidine kinase